LRRLKAALLPLRFLEHPASSGFSSRFFVFFFLRQSSSFDFRASPLRFTYALHDAVRPSLRQQRHEAAMRRLHHAASFVLRRAVRFRYREAAIPRTAVHTAASPTSGEAPLW
jgi:hypothetical protein